MKRQTSLALIAFALFGTTGIAAGADFTFNVPVNLQNVHPDIRNSTIHCRVFKVRGSPTLENTVAESARSSPIEIPIDSSGNYRGTLAITANALTGKDPSEGRYYECDLQFNSYSLQSDTRARGTAFESRAGSARTVHVSGEIPR